MTKDFKYVLIVSKQTDLEGYDSKWGPRLETYCEEYGIDIEFLKKNHKEHHECLADVIRAFEKNGIAPRKIIGHPSLSKFDFDIPSDVVVCVGGDGTFMDATRYISDDTLVFGVRSTSKSVGAHYNSDYTNAEEHICRLLKGDFSVEKRTRVNGAIGRKHSIVDIATNEIFIGDKFNPGYAKLMIGDVIKEGDPAGNFHYTGSSGLVVSTYKGRTSWYNHIPVIEKNPEVKELYNKAHAQAGLEERDTVLKAPNFKPGEEDLVKYKLREFSQGGDSYAYEWGVLRKGEKLTVISRMVSDGSVSFDGSKPDRPRSRMYDLYMGTTVDITVSDKQLHVAKFD